MSMLSLANVFASTMILTAALYLLSFAIAQVFKGFNMIQGVAMVYTLVLPL